MSNSLEVWIDSDSQDWIDYMDQDMKELREFAKKISSVRDIMFYTSDEAKEARERGIALLVGNGDLLGFYGAIDEEVPTEKEETTVYIDSIGSVDMRWNEKGENFNCCVNKTPNYIKGVYGEKYPYGWQFKSNILGHFVKEIINYFSDVDKTSVVLFYAKTLK
jgi:hypothetical protein